MSMEPRASQEAVATGQFLFTGHPVKYVDELRKEHTALTTMVWNVDDEGKPNYVNLVYVVMDESKTDQYGRQIERATSVPLKNEANSAGRYFENV